MSFFLVVVLMGVSVYVLHRWEEEDDRPAPVAPVAPSAPVADLDDSDDDLTDDDDETEEEEEEEEEEDVDDDSADPYYGATPTDAGVDVESIGWPWFDDRSCWGCDRGCKRSKFHPYSGTNIGAELRGAGAAQARARADEPYHAGFAPGGKRGQNGARRSTDVDAIWDNQCAECGRHVRRVDAGLEPVALPVVAAGTVAEVTPF